MSSSSKRGRKRNDSLPPNRARDVQRAFRARRAAHLKDLEDRVSELERENDHLRAALGLPPANRPPLGKGPTGKDRHTDISPTPHHAIASSSSSLATHSLLSDARDSSSSPDSARASSLSPGALARSMHRNVPELEPAWDQLQVLDQADVPNVSSMPSSSASTSYPLPPMNPAPLKIYHNPHTGNPYPQTSTMSPMSRSVPSTSYMGSSSSYGHSHHLERQPTPSSYGSSSSYRDEQPRSHTQYGYPTQSPYDNPMQQPPSPPMSTPSIHSSYHSPREPALSYPHRRSMTEPQQQQQQQHAQQQQQQQQYHALSHPSQNPGIRLPSPPPGHIPHHLSRAYGEDDRMDPMS